MKIRNGFVSNSSSSSFLILYKDTELSKQELIKKSTKNAKYLDEIEDNIERWAKEGKYLLVQSQVGYDGEDYAEGMVKQLLKFTDFKEENISFECNE
jgi:hypothetical protein